MTDQLREGLADLAGEVEMADLRDRALATSRRLTVRRRVTVVTAGLVAVAALIGGTATLRAIALGPEPVVPGQTSTAPTGSQSPTQEPTVTPTATETQPPPAGPFAGIGEWSSTPHPAGLPGTAVYLTETEQGLTVNRLGGGVLQSALVTSLARGYPAACSRLAAIAPDGSAVLFMAGEDYATTADVYVVSLSGGPARRVAQQVPCQGYWVPKWFPDSRSIWVPQTAGGSPTCSRVDATTGVATALAADWCGNVAFGVGQHYRVSGGNIVTWDGALVRPAPEVPDSQKPEDWVDTVYQSVSADGRYVTAAGGATDPSPVTYVCCLMDAQTGQMVPFDNLYGARVPERTELSTIVFLPNGDLLAGFTTMDPPFRYTWRLLSGGVVTASVEDAPAYMGPQVFTYLP